MAPDRDPQRRGTGPKEPREPRFQVVLYALRWLSAAAVVAGAVILLLELIDRGADPRRPRRGPTPDVLVPPRRTLELEHAIAGAGCSLRRLADEGAAHVRGPVRYGTALPASGPHSSTPVPDGEPRVPPPPERLVEVLHRGGIVIHFRPEVSATVRGQLRAVFTESTRRTVLTVNSAMRPRVAVTAWRRVLACPSPNERVFDAVRAFRERYRREQPGA